MMLHDFVLNLIEAHHGGVRPEQKAMAELIADADRLNQFQTLRAETGTGKSALICATAIHRASASEKPVLILAPTKQIRDDLGKYLNGMIQTSGKTIDVMVLESRHDYLSMDRLRKWHEGLSASDIDSEFHQSLGLFIAENADRKVIPRDELKGYGLEPNLVNLNQTSADSIDREQEPLGKLLSRPGIIITTHSMFVANPALHYHVSSFDGKTAQEGFSAVLIDEMDQFMDVVKDKSTRYGLNFYGAEREFENDPAVGKILRRIKDQIKPYRDQGKVKVPVEIEPLLALLDELKAAMKVAIKSSGSRVPGADRVWQDLCGLLSMFRTKSCRSYNPVLMYDGTRNALLAYLETPGWPTTSSLFDCTTMLGVGFSANYGLQRENCAKEATVLQYPIMFRVLGGTNGKSLYQKPSEVKSEGFGRMGYFYLDRAIPVSTMDDQENIVINPELAKVAANLILHRWNNPVGNGLDNMAVYVNSYADQRAILRELEELGIPMGSALFTDPANGRGLADFRAAREEFVTCSERGERRIFFSTQCSGWENPYGLSTLIMPRLPYAPPDAVEGEINRVRGKSSWWSFQANQDRTVRLTGQFIGRGIRKETDVCETIFLDPRMPTPDGRDPRELSADSDPLGLGTAKTTIHPSLRFSYSPSHRKIRGCDIGLMTDQGGKTYYG